VKWHRDFRHEHTQTAIWLGWSTTLSKTSNSDQMAMGLAYRTGRFLENAKSKYRLLRILNFSRKERTLNFSRKERTPTNTHKQSKEALAKTQTGLGWSIWRPNEVAGFSSWSEGPLIRLCIAMKAHKRIQVRNTFDNLR
jgi:hypothetical protein